ncbi:MAG: hypothetical protein Q7V53_07255 [Caldisericota bacterium]|nr:hypothetical protein [Caldisericota bacterium]
MSHFYFERLKVFGWIVHRKELFAGETYTVTVADDTLPEESENITFWTKGLVLGKRQDGYEPAARVAGCFSLDFANMSAGTFTFTCIEDSEWFCVNSRANRNALPTLTPVRLPAGDVLDLPAGTLLFVCTGTLRTAAGDVVAGDELELLNPAQVTAVEDVYGLIFAEERA